MNEENTSERWEVEKKVNIGIIVALVFQTLTATGSIIWITRGFQETQKQHTIDISELRHDVNMIKAEHIEFIRTAAKMDAMLSQILLNNAEMKQDIREHMKPVK